MKKKFLILLLTGPTLTWAQSKYPVSGVVADSARQPLEMATVVLLDAKDSSIVQFTHSDEKGAFTLRAATGKKYLLRASYIGYQMLQRVLEPRTETSPLALGELPLTASSARLAEVTITGEQNPVTFNKDTIEYNAGAFKVQPNASVEDLLKKLPGVQVDADGNIKAQGENVKQVLVNGKKFFGKDPKIATQNLPADAVKKVQVYDKKSDAAEFSGVEDGKKEKTINLQTKKEYQKGLFGKVATGAGIADDNSDLRYSEKTTLNRFTQTQQVSILTNLNNVNVKGYNFSDYMDFSGATRNMGQGGSMTININSNDASIPLDDRPDKGFAAASSGGLNFYEELSKKTNITTSYFFSQVNQIFDKQINTQNYLPNGSYSTLENDLVRQFNASHRVDLVLEHKLDSVQSLKLTTGFRYNQTSVGGPYDLQNYNAQGGLASVNNRISTADGIGKEAGADLLYRRKFAKKGRSLTAEFIFDIKPDSRNDQNTGRITLYDASQNIVRNDSIAQTGTKQNNAQTYTLSVNYTEPIAKKTYAQFSYSYQNAPTAADYRLYDMANGEPVFNQALSNMYESRYVYHQEGLSYRINRASYNLSFGAIAQEANLSGAVQNQGNNIDQSFFRILPTAHYDLTLEGNKHFNIDYSASTQAPTILQLQPVANTADPLRVYIGNPDLRPSYNHQFNLNYNSFDFASFRSFFIGFNANYSTDYITNSVRTDSLFRTVTTPVNVENYFSASGYGSYELPVHAGSNKLKLTFGGDVNYNRNISIINDVSDHAQFFKASVDMGFQYTPSDSFDCSFKFRPTYDLNQYSIQQSFDRSYWQPRMTADLNYHTPFHVNLHSDFNYTFYSNGLPTTPTIAVALLNVSASTFILQGNRGEMKLSVIDLFNQNQGITYNGAYNYFSAERIRSLGRYGLLSFTYSLTPRGRKQGGGMRIMIRD